MVNYLQPSGPTQFEQNGLCRIKRRRSHDQYRSERRNTFVINFNGFKNGFRPRNIGSRFFSSHSSHSRSTEFSPPYAVPSNLISGTSWTSANGFHLTSHHQLNNINPILTPGSVNSHNIPTFEQKNEDPNKIVEVESDDSPPYLPSTVAQQRPSTVTPQPSPTAPNPPHYDKSSAMQESNESSFTQVDFHHQEDPSFKFHSTSHTEELSC